MGLMELPSWLKRKNKNDGSQEAPKDTTVKDTPKTQQELEAEQEKKKAAIYDANKFNVELASDKIIERKKKMQELLDATK